jgi:hypothetical protein
MGSREGVPVPQRKGGPAGSGGLGRFPQIGVYAGGPSEQEGVRHFAQKQQIRNKIITGGTG